MKTTFREGVTKNHAIITKEENLKDQELKNKLLAAGTIVGTIYTEQEVNDKYGEGLFDKKDVTKVEAYGIYYLFRDYIYDTLSFWDADLDNVLWAQRENLTILWDDIEIGYDTKIIGYLGFKNRLFVWLENEKENIELFVEAPIGW